MTSNNTTQEFELIEYVDETPPVITFEPELQPAVYDVGIQILLTLKLAIQILLIYSKVQTNTITNLMELLRM